MFFLLYAGVVELYFGVDAVVEVFFEAVEVVGGDEELLGGVVVCCF